MIVNLKQKYTNLHPNHPILSRVCLQTLDIMKYCSKLDNNQKENIQTFCCYEGLLNFETLWEIQEKINDEYFISLNKWFKNPNDYFPGIINLRRDINLYLYTIKNNLRDLLIYCLNPLFGTKFYDGGNFSSLKDGISPIRKWAFHEYGENSLEYKFFEQHESFLTELIAKRNAIEHPGGKCGKLNIIQPFLENNQGKYKVTHPRWARNDETPVSLIDEFCNINYTFLKFTEEFLVFICLQKFLDKGRKIVKIPCKLRVMYGGKRYVVLS